MSLEETAITTLGVGGAAMLLLWSLMRGRKATPKGEDNPMPLEETAIKGAIAIGVEVVKKLFEGKKDDKDLISVGLAVGYFYNFLEVISGVIDRDEVDLYDEAKDKKQHYNAETVEVQVFLPARLDVSAFRSCEQEFKATKRGYISLKREGQIFGINYTTIQRGEKTGMVIIDLARSLMAVKRFYEEILHYNTNGDTDPRWVNARGHEITAFEETLRRLQERGHGALVNRLQFRKLG